MRRFPVLFFMTFLIITMARANNIEVIIGGKSFDSIDAYRAAKRGTSSAKASTPQKLDPDNEKAFNELKFVSSEDNVSRVKADFAQNWDNPTPKFKIEEKELEQHLEAIADNRKEPVLVVSENGKLRVMLLDEGKTVKDIPVKN